MIPFSLLISIIYKQTWGTNAVTTATLKDVVTAKIRDKLDSYHKEEKMIGGKLGSYEKEADVMLLKDDGMKGSGVGESVVS
jgi:hypothetical protein